jgi:hypothetical protein
VRWIALVLTGLACVAAGLALVWHRGACEVDDQARRPPAAAETRVRPEESPTAAPPVVQATPRPIMVRATWKAAPGKQAERYSEGRFTATPLRFGERFYIERVCVSDARKLTMISYRDAVGHTDVPLPLGDRGSGQIDPRDRNCTLFEGVEATRVEKCKCRFQCAGEAHWCLVSGVARRP